MTSRSANQIENAAVHATEMLATWVADTNFADLPLDLIPHTQRHLTDFLAVALGGAKAEAVDILLRTLVQLGNSPQATVIGHDERQSVTHAALVNGLMAHVLDFDDSFMSPTTILHANAPLWPAVLALAEWTGASGRLVVTAFVLGFEVAARVALAAGRSHLERGWHVTATTGPFGAAAAAGKILGLDPRRQALALGIALTFAGGVNEVFGSMCKSLHPGRAAMAGVLSALLAREGFDSTPRALEGPQGFLKVFTTDDGVDMLTAGLGDDFLIRQNGFKPHACGVVIHPAADGILCLRKDGLQPEEIAAIELHVHPFVLQVTGKQEPELGLEGKFSIYHAVAAAAVDGALSEAQFTDERVRDPQVVALRGRVRLHPDSELRRDEAVVEVSLRDGSRRKCHIAHALGTAANPMGQEHLNTKLERLAAPSLGSPRIKEVEDIIAKLPGLPNVASLMRLCAAGGLA